MSANTTIEWATKSWNPIRGCSRVSEGCQNCYAETQARRFAGAGGPYEGLLHPSGAWNGRIKYVPKLLDDPLKWRGERIFVNSMSDLFHEKVSDDFIDEVFQVMGASDEQGRDNVFLILTKRADRMLRYITSGRAHKAWNRLRLDRDVFPPRNVWLGVSVENQATADLRIPLLRQTPARVRFLSCEPLLGPIDLQATCWGRVEVATMRFMPIDWVIVGGESGPSARPMHPVWPRSLRDQCVAANIPFFFKQHGHYASRDATNGDIPFKRCKIYTGDDASTVTLCPVGKKRAGRLLDGRTWDQFPQRERE